MNSRSVMIERMNTTRHSLVVTTPPIVDPVSLAEFKEHARIDGNHEDGNIRLLLSAARRLLEADTQRAFYTQTLTLRLDYFPVTILLERCPVQSITSVKYYDSSNALQTLSTSVYQSDLFCEPALILPTSGQTWPTTYDRLNSVEVAFVAGYSSLSAIPSEAKQAINMLAASWYENKETVLVGTISKEIELSYRAIANSLKWEGYA